MIIISMPLVHSLVVIVIIKTERKRKTYLAKCLDSCCKEVFYNGNVSINFTKMAVPMYRLHISFPPSPNKVEWRAGALDVVYSISSSFSIIKPSLLRNSFLRVCLPGMKYVRSKDAEWIHMSKILLN